MKKKWAIISTWYMSFEGVKEAAQMLEANHNATDSIITAIKSVEDNPKYKSVGYGGLPNKNGICEFDAGWMNGDTLKVGAVGAMKDVKNPIEVAEKLSHEAFNAFLVGNGADDYAQYNGFEKKNMLSPAATREYLNKLREIDGEDLKAYDGHDTVSMVCLDHCGSIISATSTSGLFMKKPGRIGDSPIAGSGFYADSLIGGAASTGVGEEIMRSSIAYEVTRLMEDGIHPQSACETALSKFIQKIERTGNKPRAMSVIAMNKEGEWGVSTNVEFTFVIASYKESPQIYVANYVKNKIVIEKVYDTSKWASHEEHRI